MLGGACGKESTAKMWQLLLINLGRMAIDKIVVDFPTGSTLWGEGICPQRGREANQ